MEKYKILFCRQDASGCSIVRLQYPMDAINKYSDKLECKFSKSIDTITDDEFTWADLFVLQRKVIPYFLSFTKKAQKAGKKVIYEVDDSVLENHMAPENPGKPYYDRQDVQDCIKTIIGLVDGFSTTTTGLKETFDKYTKVPCTVLPNSLPLGYIDNFKLVSPLFTERYTKRTTIISWISSSFHSQDVPVILEPMKHILQKYPLVRFLLAGWTDPRFEKELDTRRLLKLPWVMIPKWYGTYRSFPIHFQVAPLKLPCPFNTGKSNIKILDGASRKTATIASPSAEYLKCTDFSTILQRNTTDEWVERLEWAIEHPLYMKEMGEHSYDILKRDFNMDKNWILWQKFYLNILEAKE